LWHDSRHEVRAELLCCASHQSRFLTLDCFWLMFTEELLNIFYWKSQIVIANNTFKDRKTNSKIRYFYWWNILFSNSDNPDGTWCSGHSTRLLVNQWYTPF
jgi:hypothetical protein